MSSEPSPAARDRFAGRYSATIVLVWGCALAFWMSYPFFVLGSDVIHDNHEEGTYVYRLIEFRDCLASGYWFPQWCTDFRGGLGSPYFSYYQPGFFYVAALGSLLVSPVRALGVAIWVFSLLG